MPKLDNLEEAVEAEIGERIRLRRAALGISQAELADKIGMSFQQVQKYERGANRIASSILIRVADALRCTPGEFLISGKVKNRGASAWDREVDAIASRIKLLKSAAVRKKLLAGVAQLLANAEAATKSAKRTAQKKAPARGAIKTQKAPPKPSARASKSSR